MRYWNNFWDNLKVWWNKHDLSDNETLRNFGIKEVNDSIKTSTKIKLKNPNIDEINDILEILSGYVKKSAWHTNNPFDQSTLEKMIYDILYPKTASPKQINKEVNIIKSLNNNTETKNQEPLKQSEPHHLSQQDILIFCGSLLEMLKNGTAPFENDNDKIQYLEEFFRVKNQIANIESILLFREILNRTKPTEKNKENNNEDNGNIEGNKLSTNEQKLEIKKLCDEIYNVKDKLPMYEKELEIKKLCDKICSAFESSVKEYKDLELEIKKEYLDINKDKGTSDSDASNITLDGILQEYDDICKSMHDHDTGQMLNLILPLNKQQNQGNAQSLHDLYKKQQKFAKLCEKVKLANIFKNYIYNQIANFADTFYYNEEDSYATTKFGIEKKSGVANEICISNLQKMLKIIKGTEISNTDIIKTIRGVLSQKDQNQINSIVDNNNDANKDNINDKIDKINEDNNVDDSVSFSKRPSCFLDSICCSICTDEPVLYSAKDINSKEDLYREPKIQKKENNNKQEPINFDTNIYIRKKYNRFTPYEEEDGTFINNNNNFSSNNNKSNNNINGNSLYEGTSLYNMNNKSSEKQNRMFGNISQYNYD